MVGIQPSGVRVSEDAKRKVKNRLLTLTSGSAEVVRRSPAPGGRPESRPQRGVQAGGAGRLPGDQDDLPAAARPPWVVSPCVAPPQGNRGSFAHRLAVRPGA